MPQVSTTEILSAIKDSFDFTYENQECTINKRKDVEVLYERRTFKCSEY